eukprot:m.58227 g.58227  ORF g.58227 m.58227 type:complete len:276 (+) comp11162_c0_seq2:285-1112(+)
MWISIIISSIVVAQDPPNAVDMIVYHVHPPQYTGLANMNTGDVLGDSFFKYNEVLTTQICEDPNSKLKIPGLCDNPEQFSPLNVISKVTLRVNPHFGRYGSCNICTKAIQRMVKCTLGTYFCSCGGECPPIVGREYVPDRINQVVPRGLDRETFWIKNLANRTGGMWYSTPETGECGNPRAEQCNWKLVNTLKVINASCLDGLLDNELTRKGASCFNKCGDQSRNTSSLCYATCYYGTLLGPSCIDTYPCVGGFSKEQLTEIWENAFQVCPSVQL